MAEFDSKKNLEQYYLNIGNSLDSKWNQLRNILGDSHYPSVGNYTESLIRNELRKFLPKDYSVGTGFVAFPNCINKGLSHTVSKQLDIVIYKNTESAPIYEDGDFVVLLPESVVAFIEVKSALDSRDVDKIYEIYRDYCEKHMNYIHSFNIMHLNAPTFFAYSLAKKRSPKKETVLNKLKENLIKHIEFIENEATNPFSGYSGLNIRHIFCQETIQSTHPTFGGFYVNKQYGIVPQKQTDNKRNNRYVLKPFNGKTTKGDDVTFVNMVVRLMGLCNIPYNAATITSDANDCSGNVSVDIYSISENKIIK